MKKNSFWKLAAMVTFIALASILIFIIIKEYKLAQDHRFTICTTTDDHGGGIVEFQFTVNDKKFNGRDRGWLLKSKGGRYFVKYYVEDPSNCKVVSNIEVPECVGDAPVNGWDRLPVCK